MVKVGFLGNSFSFTTNFSNKWIVVRRGEKKHVPLPATVVKNHPVSGGSGRGRVGRVFTTHSDPGSQPPVSRGSRRASE